ncbi:TonB-dependent receptor [Ferrimonas lipolytica]|uniref:TonB-dependent receptor n=1 Tax=Ferrimonas lipolytica TaxID=2724191 RepID=A0A6H1UD27_9GAMM|nr:TonB-dependent receptor [Ferrimonas lipolytica]QIZ76944.1 TonB-dependent receptor [Ferrimonas lipolytica]
MAMESSISKAVRRGLIYSSLTAVALGTTNFAVAAEEVQGDVERISVTGSRIAREGTITASPVTVITAEQLTSSGAVNIGEALNELPALASTFSLSSSTEYIGTAGLNILDLRNMGTSRTLVLVDGKRHVSSQAGDSTVDVNTIPTEWVESVEIITGGASAIYGADAVTGVVNFRLKKDITGFNVSATAGEADDSDYDNKRFALSYGSDFADGAGNAGISIEHSSQSALAITDRDATATSWTTVNDPTGENVKRYVEGGHYAINNAAVIYGPWNGLDKSYSFNPDGSMREVYTGPNTEGTKCWGDCDYVNLNQYEDLQPEFDRTTINFKTNYDVTDDLTASFQAKWSETNATSRSQPAFFFGNLTLDYDNAFIQDDFKQVLTDAGYESGDSFYINRFLNDMGQRLEEDERTTQRYVASLEGVVWDEWDFEAYGIYGETELERENQNNLIYSNFFNAIDAVEIDGEIVCASEDARAEGCVAANIFADGAVTAEAADYMTTNSVSTATVEQYVFGTSIANGALFELPAGDVGFAAGIEYRKEKMETTEDELSASGDTFFNAFPNEKADFDVKEIFAEFTIPLLYDQYGIDSLTFDTAIRYADYSTVGDATSWKVGLDWVVYDDLRVRATYATAVRAPNLGEFYGAETQNFFSADDSCKVSEMEGLAPEQLALRQANCAALGVAADFDSDYDSASLDGVNKGNEDLDPEESDSYTVGIVFQPEFLDGFSATIDYWNIEITDAISGVSAQTMIDRCIDDPSGINNQYCALVERDDSGEIVKITNQVINVAKQEAEGIDFEFAYDVDLYDGDLRTGLIATYLIKRDEYAFQDDDDFDEYQGVAGDPEWSGIFTVDYTWNNWNANWKIRYIDEVETNTQQFYDNYATQYSNGDHWASYTTHDVRAVYGFENGVELGFGIDNLFDKDLPEYTSGTSATSATYDNIGRFYYVTFSYAM